MVESYVPQLDQPTAVAITSRFRTAIRQLNDEGVALQWIQSFAVIDEETYLCIVAARDLNHVVQMSERVGVGHEHVVEMVAIDEPRHASTA